ncbi:ABC transporter substrate-binding protein [Paenibacillus sp. S150]|uniref:ABC transporter substrate-binding protein n=1 Tax=Paenibacillus sp. S150 TaxID=2749826 RepID=UPI001C56AD3F|nr:hypothetical protein [Paenibacillus sp. S150]MBW4082557.1 ABC transporter substrate-binding protein [Paenibacillus sp. S150]
MSIKEFRYTICPVGNSSYIALNKGWVHEEISKLGVTPILLQSLPREQWHVHYDYQDPALFREGGNIPPIWAKSNGAEVVLIGLTFLTQKDYILVRADSPIDSVEQLRNSKLGVPSRPEFLIDFYKATVEHGFETALAARGVSISAAQFIELPTDEGYVNAQADHKSNLGKIDADALISGKVDAIFSGGAKAQALLNTGKYKAIYEVSANPDQVWPINNSYPNVLTVSKRLAVEAPEVVVAYVKQLLLAADWAKSNRPEVLTLFSQQIHATEGEVNASRPSDFHKHLEPGLNEQGLLALEGQKRFLFDHGYIRNDFDIEPWADSSFLKAALAEIERDKSTSAAV